MVSRKIKIKRIENPTTRQVTFSKRRGGLLKKAHDLAVLCDVEVAVIIFSSKGKLFQFASPSMGKVLERYVKSCEDAKAPNNDSSDIAGIGSSMTQSSEKFRTLQSLVYGDLDRRSLRDLISLEQQIHDSLNCIRLRKEELLLKQLEDVRDKVAEAQKTRIAHSNILNQLLELVPSDSTDSPKSGGQGGSEHHHLEEVPETCSSYPLWIQATEAACEGLPPPPMAKRPVIQEDLNKLPPLMDD